MSPSSKPTTPRKGAGSEDPELSVESITLDSPLKLPGKAALDLEADADLEPVQGEEDQPEQEEEGEDGQLSMEEPGHNTYVDSLVRDAQSEVSTFTRTPFADIVDLDIAPQQAGSEDAKLPAATAEAGHALGEEPEGDGSGAPNATGSGLTGHLRRLSQNTVAVAKDQWKTVVETAGPTLRQAGSTTTAFVGSTWQAVAEQTTKVREDGLLQTTTALVGSTIQAVAQQTNKVRDDGIMQTTQALVGSFKRCCPGHTAGGSIDDGHVQALCGQAPREPAGREHRWEHTKSFCRSR